MISGINRALAGQPDHVLTFVLLVAAAVCLLVAWKGPPALKAVVAAWVVVP